MRPSQDTEQAIGNRVYRVRTSTLLAHDCGFPGDESPWGGITARMLDRRAPSIRDRYHFVYRTAKGNYFVAVVCRDGREFLAALSPAKACDAYGGLQYQEVPRDEAFPGFELEDA